MAPSHDWHVLPSSPSATSVDSGSNFWSNMTFDELQLPSPASSYEQSFTSAEYCDPEYFSAPMTSAMTSAGSYVPRMPTMPMPSSLGAQQCGPTVGFGGFGGFDWDRCHDFSMQYATTI